MSTFTEMGFAGTVTATSSVQTNGYIGTRGGYPYNIHPTETPSEWQALQEAITADTVIVAPYVTPAPPSATERWNVYQAKAKAALTASDVVVTRVSEAICLGATTTTASDVVAYMQYRRELRAILSQAQPTTIPTNLPVEPVKPVGT